MADQSEEVTALRAEVAELRAELAAAKAAWTARDSSAAPSDVPQSGGDDEEDILQHLLRPESPLPDWMSGDDIDRLLLETEGPPKENIWSAEGSLCGMVIPGSPLTVSFRVQTAAGDATGSVGGADDLEAAPVCMFAPGAAAAAAAEEPGSVDGGDDPGVASGRPLPLVLGDSIARDAPWREEVLCLAEGGNNWARQLKNLTRDLGRWDDTAKEEDRPKGTILLWLGSNDVYPRRGQRMTTPTATVHEVLGSLLRDPAQDVIVIGPLPRGRDRGDPWQQTKACWLERNLKRTVGEYDRCQFFKPGHRLTHSMSKVGRVVGEGAQIGGRFVPWFQTDRVHITPEGYNKIRNLLPQVFLK